MFAVYEIIFWRVISAMRRGTLEITLPDGSQRHIGGQETGPLASLHIRDPRFYRDCVLQADVGFGESYVNGYWDSEDIAAVVRWFLINREETPGLSGSQRKSPLLYNALGILNKIRYKLRANTIGNSRKNIHEHYDLSNPFFGLFLDGSMTYSCAYFQHPEQDLEAAQIAKYDTLCKKLHLTADDHVLEIGSGWGGFSIHAAKTYGCRVTTVTISNQQYDYALRRIAEEGLSDRITIELKDYRHITGQFTKIASIEMLEAVGDEFLETYFAQCSRLLTPDGLLGIQVITCPDARFQHMKQGMDFVQKHIFPGSLLPSVARINQAVNRTSDLCLLGLEDMAHFYAKTLKIWHERFQAQVDKVQGLGFSQGFIRKWRYYLGYCESAFAARNISVVQIIYTRPNNLTLARSLDPDLP